MEFRHLQCKAKGSTEAALLDLTKTLIILFKTESVYNQASAIILIKSRYLRTSRIKIKAICSLLYYHSYTTQYKLLPINIYRKKRKRKKKREVLGNSEIFNFINYTNLLEVLRSVSLAFFSYVFFLPIFFLGFQQINRYISLLKKLFNLFPFLINKL